MTDALGEEYKHFSMDLEFLLRRTPTWREIAQGVLFKEGDIVEHGEDAEAAATGDEDDARRPRRRDGRWLARDRELAMNHLLRGHAPISDDGWKLIDTEARDRLVPGLAARRLIDFAGPLGWEYSATNLGRVEPVEGERRAHRGAAPPRLAAGGAAGAVLGLPRGAPRG